EVHFAVGNTHGILEWERGEGLAEAARKIANSQCIDLRVIIAFLGHGHEFTPSLGEGTGAALQSETRIHHALAGGKVAFCEEARATVSHGHQRLAIHGGVEPELEEPRVAVAEEMVNVNIVSDHLARDRRMIKERHLG